jgi:hypothetical protein
MSLYPELDRLSASQLRAAFLDEGQAKQHGDESQLWLQEIPWLLAELGDDEISFLLNLLPQVDELRLRAILIGLCSPGAIHSTHYRNEIIAAAFALLHDSRSLVVADAIELLRCLDCFDARDAVLSLCRHVSPQVVSAAHRYLARLFPKEAKSFLIDALASKESIIRENALDELDYLDCTEALPNIRHLLHDDDPFVRQAAQTAVTNLEELAAVAD